MYDYWSRVFEGQEPHGNVVFYCDVPACKTNFRTKERTLKEAIMKVQTLLWTITAQKCFCPVHHQEAWTDILGRQAYFHGSSKPEPKRKNLFPDSPQRDLNFAKLNSLKFERLIRRRMRYKFYVPLLTEMRDNTITFHLRDEIIFRSSEQSQNFEISPDILEHL